MVTEGVFAIEYGTNAEDFAWTSHAQVGPLLLSLLSDRTDSV